MLSFKQGNIKCRFLSLRDDTIWDWTPVFQAMGENSILKTNELVKLNIIK